MNSYVSLSTHLFFYCYKRIEMMLGYKYTFDLKEGKSTSVMQEQMPSQREQTGVLFTYL
jgi:hypothetical protein